ncbi:hypothetical protein ALPO108162_03050 [Alicyclobacillus pomorum]
MTDAAVICTEVTKQYGQKYALQQLNLTIPSGRDRYCRTGRRHGADVRFERGHRQKRHSQASWVRTSEHYVVRKAEPLPKGP